MARVILFCASKSWGGLEQVAAKDAKLLVDSGVEVVAMGVAGTPFLREVSKDSRICQSELKSFPRNFMDYRLIRELRRLLREKESVVITHQPSLLGSVVPALVGLRKTRLLVFRHIWSDHQKRSFYHRWLYSWVTRLIVVSETIRENVLSTHSIDPENVEVVRLGLDLKQLAFDPERRRATRTQLSIDSSHWVLGVVGRLDPGKGQAILLEALALARPRARDFSRWRLLIVGEETLGGPQGYRAELEALSKQQGLSSQVLFTGFRADVAAVLAALDLFVMPSREEAFGLVAIEALASGCPILISDGGSAREIQKEFGSQHVALVSALNAPELSQALLEAESLLGPTLERHSPPDSVLGRLEGYSEDSRRRQLHALI